MAAADGMAVIALELAYGFVAPKEAGYRGGDAARFEKWDRIGIGFAAGRPPSGRLGELGVGERDERPFLLVEAGEKGRNRKGFEIVLARGRELAFGLDMRARGRGASGRFRDLIVSDVLARARRCSLHRPSLRRRRLNLALDQGFSGVFLGRSRSGKGLS